MSGAGAVADANSELDAFIARIDAAQDEFAHGRPGAFKALWSHTDDVTLIGGLGGVVERGWAKVGARLDWASSNYAEGDRSNQIVSRSVTGDVAYLVRKEIIEARSAAPAPAARGRSCALPWCSAAAPKAGASCTGTRIPRPRPGRQPDPRCTLPAPNVY